MLVGVSFLLRDGHTLDLHNNYLLLNPSPVFNTVNNYVSTMITMINEDKDRSVVMAVLASLEEMLKSMKQDVLQGDGNFEGICTAVKNVLMSKVRGSDDTRGTPMDAHVP